MEIWNNIGGTLIYQLKENPRFPDKPDSSTIVPSMESPKNRGDNYGLRLTAYYKVLPKKLKLKLKLNLLNVDTRRKWLPNLPSQGFMLKAIDDNL